MVGAKRSLLRTSLDRPIFRRSARTNSTADPPRSRQSAAIRFDKAVEPPPLLRTFFSRWSRQLPLQAHCQLLHAGPAQQIPLDQLQHPPCGSPPREQLQQQRRNQRQIHLRADPTLRFRQPVTILQDALDPPKEQFHLPPTPIQL